MKIEVYPDEDVVDVDAVTVLAGEDVDVLHHVDVVDVHVRRHEAPEDAGLAAAAAQAGHDLTGGQVLG